MNMLSVNLDSLLQEIGQTEQPVTTKIEDQTYIDNALRMMQVSKGLDLQDEAEKAFHKGFKAFKLVEKLVVLRKEQQCKIGYDTLLAPFYFKIGDLLATYILLNQNEMGQIKPFEEEVDYDDEPSHESDQQA